MSRCEVLAEESVQFWLVATQKLMAGSAHQNVELGAPIIDINMGCPAKKSMANKRRSAAA